MKGFVKDFFVSYNQANAAWAEWIAWQLEKRGYRTVLQAWDFPGSSNFVAEMERAIQEAARLVAVISPTYLASKYTTAEWTAYFNRDPDGTQGLILPVRVEDCDPPMLLGPLDRFDLFGLSEKEARHVLLRAALQRSGPASSDRTPPVDAPPRQKPRRAPAFPGAPTGTAAPTVAKGLQHHLPLRNPYFTGREALLSELRTLLQRQHTAALTYPVQVLQGMGGVGKTQTAIEYGYRYQAEYALIGWLRAEQATDLATDYAALAGALQLPEVRQQEQQQAQINAVRRWLEKHDGWLLIFDNAEEPEQLRPYLPRPLRGQVLITSRRDDWGDIALSLPVPCWPRAESIEFLLRRTGRNAERAEAEGLAELLGDLPLALEQAASYMKAARISLAEYQKRFKQYQGRMMAEQRGLTGGYQRTIATTWEMALQALQAAPLAVEVLTYAAYLAPEAIPRDLLERYIAEKVPPEEPAELALDDALAALCRYALIEQEEAGVRLHRLVQAVVRERQAAPDEAAKAAAARLLASFPSGVLEVENWPTCAALLPHARMAAEHVQGVAPGLAAVLRQRAGDYLVHAGRAEQAVPLLRQALDAGQQAPEMVPEDLAMLHDSLAEAYKWSGDFRQAEEVYRAALVGYATAGRTDRVMRMRVELAHVANRLGERQRARSEADQALAWYDDPSQQDDTGLNNLAVAYKHLGELEIALRLYERSQALKVERYGAEHPEVVVITGNIGHLYLDLGRREEALAQVQRAVVVAQKSYRLAHPNLAMVYAQLGNVRHALGDHSGARRADEEALAIYEEALGPCHPSVAYALYNLGVSCSDLGEYTTAQGYLRRAVEIAEQAYGADHCEVAVSLRSLGIVYYKAGDAQTARPLLEQALAIYSTKLGDEHEQTKLTRHYLAQLENGLPNP